MEKRKLKLNILDIAIVVIIICSAAVLMFRDTINEFFSEPEMATINVTFFVDGEDSVILSQNALGKTVTFVVDDENEFSIEGRVISVKAAPGSLTVPKQAEVTVSIVGYKKLGRHFTESGERIYINSECAFVNGETTVEGVVVSVEKIG